MLHNHGEIAWRRGDGARGEAHLNESLEIAGEVGDRQLIAANQLMLGRAAVDREELDRARVLLDESLATSRELGDTYGIASALDGLGRAAIVAGRPEEGLDLFDTAAGLRRTHGLELSSAERDDLERFERIARGHQSRSR